MLKDRIRNLFILISFMLIANGFIYYKTSSLDTRVLKMHALLLVAYLVWDFIFSKIKKGDHQLRNLFILLVIMGAFDVYRYFTSEIIISDLIYKYIFVIGVFLITCFVVYVISRRNE